MKKGEPTPQRIRVEYKGGELILPPGHKVFECNTETGEVKEHKLILKEKPLLTRIGLKLLKNRIGPVDDRPTYKVDEMDGFIHMPAFNREKAVVIFRKLLREFKLDIKPY